MTLEERIAQLEKRIAELEDAYNRCASLEYYHDEYASVDHVERSEGEVERQLYRLRNDLDNLEYRINDVDRTAERAQSAADDARRSQRGGW